MGSYPAIDMHKKVSKSLVVHCSDPRFQDAYRAIIDNLGHYYDLVVAPGASKAIADDKSIVDYIKLLASLHHFEEVHILDHVNCAALGPVDDEIKAHKDYLKKAEASIKNTLNNVAVHWHLLGEDKELDLAA